MQNLIGIRHEQSMVVDDASAVTFLDHAGARVLGTPWMILWMERTAREAVKPLLPEGWDTVGTAVNVRHLSAAPLGAQVTFHAEVVEQTERRIVYKVSAESAAAVIGDGTHERTLIDVERFAARLARQG